MPKFLVQPIQNKFKIVTLTVLSSGQEGQCAVKTVRLI